MTPTEFAEQTILAGKREHKSRKTWQQYGQWARRFGFWLQGRKHIHDQTSEIKVSSFLSWLASRPGGCAPRTQHQALCALVFAFKKGLGRELLDMPEWVKPPATVRLPVWLSIPEFNALSRHLNGACLELAQLMFGSGLRLNEALKLRVRDIDFSARLITVRGGKGDKDRTTCFPTLLQPVFHERLQRLNDLWQSDRDNDVPGVWLPDDVARKYPNYGRDWPWQFLFPGAKLCTDPETGIIRRHHLHEDTLSKALKQAAYKARLCKRITVHSLRHSFATAFLETGGSIHKLQSLLGHKSIETTEIYTHCIRQFASDVVSPLDAAATHHHAGKVIPFEAAIPTDTVRRIS